MENSTKMSDEHEFMNMIEIRKYPYEISSIYNWVGFHPFPANNQGPQTNPLLTSDFFNTSGQFIINP